MLKIPPNPPFIKGGDSLLMHLLAGQGSSTAPYFG